MMLQQDFNLLVLSRFYMKISNAVPCQESDGEAGQQAWSFHGDSWGQTNDDGALGRPQPLLLHCLDICFVFSKCLFLIISM